MEELEWNRRRVRELKRIVTERDSLEALHRKDAIRLMKAFRPAKFTAQCWATDERRLTRYLPSLGGIRDAQDQHVGDTPYTEEKPLSNIHPDDRERVARVWDRASKGHEAYAIDYRFISGNGEVRHQHEIGTPKFDGSGQYEGHFGTTQDKTGQKQAEEKRRESEVRYRQLFDSSPIGLWEED